MKILVDYDHCEGHGLCEETAPKLFQLDDDGNMTVLTGENDIPEDQHDRALRAVRGCPSGALRAE